MEDMTSDERWLAFLDALEALSETGWTLETFDTEVQPETVSLVMRATFANPVREYLSGGQDTGEDDD